MALLERFDPPAFLPDFNSISGQLDAWHRAVSAWFDASIEADSSTITPGAPFLFYNPSILDPGGTTVEQAIVWNAFPKELLRLYGRERALFEADQLWALERYYSDLHNLPVDRKEFPGLFDTFFRPQNEYCEWHVTRDPATNKILRVTFTSEPPEFWYALFGSSVPGDNNNFPGDRDFVLHRYHEMVSADVQAADLVAQRDLASPSGAFSVKGQYDIYNKWNTTHGIVHLCAPPNSLMAEIQLGADATILRKNKAGRMLVEPEVLICCAQYGGPDRNSDPTIGSSVNALARLGAYITLRNPVGLYMDHVDLSGWEAPDGGGVSDCLRIVRGSSTMIERMVVEVPAKRGFTVSDLRIGGAAVLFGGQIAECITVKLVGVARLQPHPLPNHPVACSGRCFLDNHHAIRLVRSVDVSVPVPQGTQEAFADEGGEEKRRNDAVELELREQELANRKPKFKAKVQTRMPAVRLHRRNVIAWEDSKND